MDADWLKSHFDQNPDKRKSDLAKLMLVEPSAISKILNGTRRIQANEYAVIESYFGLPASSQISNEPLSVHSELKDIAGIAAEAEPVPETRHKKNKQTEQPVNTMIFIVNDEMMQPEYRIGSRVMIDLMDTDISSAGTFLLSDGYNKMLRYCAQTPHHPSDFRISARSSDFETQILHKDDVFVIGRAVATRPID